ncbi:MAG TPA: hypothetical protein VMN36_19625 [Verrucomicrobiales bacterium]|nr:hypothetical protein [Verrucomicrobiales bacterium]
MDRHVDHAREEIRRLGPLQAFRAAMAKNESLIRSPLLDEGDHIVATRSAMHHALVEHWASRAHREFGYDRPFAIAALGGTGRCELTPCSDLDYVFLFDDVIEGNAFLIELRRQVFDTREFQEEYGFDCPAMHFNLEDVPHPDPRQNNSFLDLRAVYEADGLTARFRERMQAFGDPFQHFLHVRGFWKNRWEQAAVEFDRLDAFDIKNDGLRIFLAGVWALAGKGYVHSFDIYRELDPRDLEAYDFLLRIRAFAHLQRTVRHVPLGGGNHSEDILGFGEFDSFAELLPEGAGDRERFDFANEVRARLLSARRRTAHFAKGVIERELRIGRRLAPGSPIIHGPGGLFYENSPPMDDSVARSRAAFSLLHASQHYEVAVDPAELQSTFRDAGDWLTLVPDLAELFYERQGNLAGVLTFVAQLDGAEDRLFPGYGRFEVSFDVRVLQERRSLRGALVQEKIRWLEEELVRVGRERREAWIGGQGPATPGMGGRSAEEDRQRDADRAALLSPDELAAVKLTLKTKRLPLTARDLEKQENANLPLHERFASGFSGIPLEAYYLPFVERGGFTQETVDMCVYLLEHRRLFQTLSEAAISDFGQVQRLWEVCPDERRLRALFVFTCADRANWESEEVDPARWFNIRELYAKAMRRYSPGGDPERSLAAAGFSQEDLEVLRGFGPALFEGSYGQYLSRLGAHLLRLGDQSVMAGPKVSLIQNGASKIAAVAARDFRGLAASISGAFWRQGVAIRQAHLFSAAEHGLAFDFFHFDPSALQDRAELQAAVETAIRERQHIADADEGALPQFTGDVSLAEWSPGLYRLLFETDQEAHGLIYFLTYKIFRYLGGNIFGLVARTNRGRASVSIYHDLPAGMPLEAARALAERF